MLCAALCLAACAGVPSQPGELTRWERDRLDRIERGLAASPLRVRDASLERYLAHLLGRLDAAPPVRFYVLRGASVQADLLGGEVLRLRTGLLAGVRDEDELAFVLAHELSHRRLGHVAARRGPGWDAMQAELAADRAALERLVALGYRRSAGLALLQRIARQAGPPASSLLQSRIEALRESAAPGEAAGSSTGVPPALRPYRSTGDPE
jgi:predicted Zn-dependent protease